MDFSPTSFDTLPLALVTAVSKLSGAWSRLDDVRRELNTVQGTLQSISTTAAPRLSDHERAQLSYLSNLISAQDVVLINQQTEVSRAMNEVDVVKNLLQAFIPDQQRLIREEQANYERNHELQEQLDEIRAELKERGIVL